MKVEATRVVSKLKEAGHEASFVGGSVRDMLLKRDIHDYDIATSATISQIKRLFPQVLEVGRSFGVCLVTINGHDFQVATYRRDGSYSDSRHPDSITITSSMEEDACRRDFTCNAMYYDPIEDRLIDYFKGTSTLKLESWLQ
jgi:poly(A) polymerase